MPQSIAAAASATTARWRLAISPFSFLTTHRPLKTAESFVYGYSTLAGCEQLKLPRHLIKKFQYKLYTQFRVTIIFFKINARHIIDAMSLD